MDRLAEPPTDDCLIWPYSSGSHGYGQVTCAGRSTTVHTLVLEMTVGPRPEGHYALHECPDGLDNKLCYNPRHLRWGTPSENSLRAHALGRNPGVPPKGEAHRSAKLTEADVRKIRERFAAGESKTAIAAAYGVSRQNVGFIVRRATWREVQ